MQGEPEVYCIIDMYKLQFLLLIAVICDTVDNCAPLKVLFVFNGPILRAAGSNSTVELYGGTVLNGTSCTLIDLPYHTSTSTVVLV